MAHLSEEEFKKIVAGLKSIYTSDGFIKDENAFRIWYHLLKNYTYSQLNLAVETYMRSGIYPPTPADIIMCVSKQDPEQDYLPEEEAWQLVARACANGNYGWNEEFQKLPKVVQGAVGSPYNIHDWAAVDIADFQTVIHSNFLRSYRSAVAREKEFNTYPDRLKAIISGATQKMIGER